MKLVSWLTSIKLENVFVKHYAPNHMFAPTENIYHLSLWSLIGTKLFFFTKCQSRKKEIIQSDIHRIWQNVKQVIYIMYPNSTLDIMILA